MNPYRLFILCCSLTFSLSQLSAQTTWEFSGTTYAFQKAHFDSATNVVNRLLSVQMRTFGAPYNQIDATLIQVMSEDPRYRVLLFGQFSPSPASGQINLTNRVLIESATGVPSFSYFLSSWYSKKGTYTDYMVMQGHPFDWTTPAKMTEFSNIINYLIATDSVVFNTPYGYYRYLNDLSIPRTSKIQVILKLDDLRAASYFYPSLPTYDTLVAKKVKASFGVNKMETLTPSQITTLKYYLAQTTVSGDTLFEIWNHGLDHSQTVVTSGGNWSDPSIWPGEMVPTAADDVTIPTGTTITVDVADAICGDLTVNGTLVMLNTAVCSLTVQGNLLINSGGSFTSPSLTGATSNIVHSLSVYGNFTNNGGTFDFRQGSAGTTLRAMNTTFLGSGNSTVSVGTYTTTNNNFNGITVNKSGGAKLICASDVVCDPGSSLGVSQLIFSSGIIETGANAIYALSTTSTDVVTPSSSSYVNGALGRGISNSGSQNKLFPVGDQFAYRPISVRNTTSGTATGHYVIVRCIHGSASTGSSMYTGGIDTVSTVRYYQINYNKGIGAGATSMSFSQFSPSYGADDGIQPGNTNLRVAYSTDERATWNGMNQSTAHTTSLTSPPTTIVPTALTTAVTLNSGSGYIYAVLSDLSGSNVNPLPVELVSFSAQPGSRSVLLKWNTAGEVNNQGFHIERKKFSELLGSEPWDHIGTVEGSGTINAPRSYSFDDRTLSPGRYSYRLKQVDRDGGYSYSPVVETEFLPVPKILSLSDNYPNPFNPSTTIRFTLPADGHASVKIFTLLGQELMTIADGMFTSGIEHRYEFNAGSLSSGIYFAQLQFGKSRITKRMMLMK
jgi:hypothetical protein